VLGLLTWQWRAFALFLGIATVVTVLDRVAGVRWIEVDTLPLAVLGGAIGIFVRRKLTQLSEVIARTRQIFPKLGAKYNEQQKTWTMANIRKPKGSFK